MEKARILVVEDEGLVALAIKEYLEGIGHEVPRIVTSGEDAIKMIAETGPDLVLMDIHLSGVMDGIEAASIIKDSYHIPVIYLTAYSDGDTLEQAKTTDPFGYILKPFDERSLQATIEMALHKSAIQSELRQTKNRMEIILQSIGDGIIVTGLNGIIEYMNPTAIKLLRVAPPIKPQTSVFQLMKVLDAQTGAPAVLHLENVVMEGESVKMTDKMLRTKDDRSIPVDIELEPLRDEGGNIRGIVIAFRDISERRKIQELIDRELQSATNIHKSLIPENGASINGYELQGFILTASYGAGDIYNFYRIDDRHIGMYILDVMGHGIAASSMSMLVYRLLVPDQDGDNRLAILDADPLQPKQVVEKLNGLFCSSVGQMFFTICYAVIDTDSGKIRIVRAGHPYPIFQRKDGSVREIQTGGYAVGFMRKFEIAEFELEIEVGDKLFFYSDGLTDCVDSRMVQFTKDHLVSLIAENYQLGLKETVERIKREVGDWRGKEAFDDDIALFGVRYTEL